MPDKPKHTLQELQDRTRYLEHPQPTSHRFSKIGWPMLGIGLVFWLVVLLSSHLNFFTLVIAVILVGGGAFAIILSFFSSHSEDIESSERSRKIRERSTNARCIYLEGSIPDGKGTIGRCRLYEFDMIDLPYCLYCEEYTAGKGSPNV